MDDLRKAMDLNTVLRTASRNPEVKYYDEYYEVFRERYKFFLQDYTPLERTPLIRDAQLSPEELTELMAPGLFYIHLFLRDTPTKRSNLTSWR